MAPAADGSCSTALIIQVEMPAIGLMSQVSFDVKPSKQEQLFDGTTEFVQALANQFEDMLINIDTEGTSRKLEHMRKKGLCDLEGWQARLKQVDEWKMKVNRAQGQMNKMREAYFKELFQLREQVYQKEKATREGTDFQPSTAIHFDPSEFTLDDEVTRLVEDKVSLIRQDFAYKTAELEVRASSRVSTLTNQLMTTKLLLTRKEQLLSKVMTEHKYESEDSVTEKLGAVKVCQQTIQSQIETKMKKAEDKAHRDFLNRQEAGPRSEERQVADHFRSFLERRFGSMQEARTHFGLHQSMDKCMGPAEFKTFFDWLDYACPDEKQAFQHLSGEQPSITLDALLDKVQQLTAPAETGTPRAGRLHRKGSPLDTMGLSPISESESAFGSDGFDGLDSDSDESAVSSQSQASSTKVSVSVKTKGSKSPGLRVAKGGATRRQPTGRGGSSIQSGGTTASCSGCASPQRMSDQVRDQGTDAVPYEAMFPKIHKRTCAVQSFIDARLLEKAAEFFDKQAEDTWNQLACIAVDTDDEDSCPGTGLGRGHRSASSEALGPAVSLSIPHQISEHRHHRFSEPASGVFGWLGNRSGGELGTELDGKCNGDGAADMPPPRVCTFSDFGAIQFNAVHNEQPEQTGHLLDMLNSGKSLNSDRSRQHLRAEVMRRASAAKLEHLSSMVRIPATSSLDTSSSSNQGTSAAIEVQVRDIEIQCAMTRIVMLAPFERWIPGEDDPHDIQLEQVMEMARELEERIPPLQQRVEKLAVEAKPGSRLEQEVLLRLQRLLNLLPHQQASTSTSSRPLRGLDTMTHALEASEKKALGLGDVLSRHGIAADATTAVADDDPDMRGRHTFCMGQRHKRALGGKMGSRETTKLEPPGQVFSDDDLDTANGPAKHIALSGNSGLRRQLATTAKPMSSVDPTRLITERVRRHSAESYPHKNPSLLLDETEASVASAAPAPGWSGLMPEASFTFRGVQSELDVTDPNLHVDKAALDNSPVRGAARPAGLHRVVASNLTFNIGQFGSPTKSPEVEAQSSSNVGSRTISNAMALPQQERKSFMKDQEISRRTAQGRGTGQAHVNAPNAQRRLASASCSDESEDDDNQSVNSLGSGLSDDHANVLTELAEVGTDCGRGRDPLGANGRGGNATGMNDSGRRIRRLPGISAHTATASSTASSSTSVPMPTGGRMSFRRASGPGRFAGAEVAPVSPSSMNLGAEDDEQERTTFNGPPGAKLMALPKAQDALRTSATFKRPNAAAAKSGRTTGVRRLSGEQTGTNPSQRPIDEAGDAGRLTFGAHPAIERHDRPSSVEEMMSLTGTGCSVQRPSFRAASAMPPEVSPLSPRRIYANEPRGCVTAPTTTCPSPAIPGVRRASTGTPGMEALEAPGTKSATPGPEVEEATQAKALAKGGGGGSGSSSQAVAPAAGSASPAVRLPDAMFRSAPARPKARVGAQTSC